MRKQYNCFMAKQGSAFLVNLFFFNSSKYPMPQPFQAYKFPSIEHFDNSLSEHFSTTESKAGSEFLNSGNSRLLANFKNSASLPFESTIVNLKNSIFLLRFRYYYLTNAHKTSLQLFII